MKGHFGRGIVLALAGMAVAGPAEAAGAATRPPHLPGAQSPAMVAMHARQRQCGQQWRADKAANKLPAGQKWAQYWSACNKRLKG